MESTNPTSTDIQRTLAEAYGEALAILKQLHDPAKNSPVVLDLIRNKRYCLPDSFKNALQLILQSNNKSIIMALLSDFEEAILDKEHNGDHALALVYGANIDQLHGMKDISDTLSKLTTSYLENSDLKFYVSFPTQAPPPAAPPGSAA